MWFNTRSLYSQGMFRWAQCCTTHITKFSSLCYTQCGVSLRQDPTRVFIVSHSAKTKLKQDTYASQMQQATVTLQLSSFVVNLTSISIFTSEVHSPFTGIEPSTYDKDATTTNYANEKLEICSREWPVYTPETTREFNRFTTMLL